MFSVTGSSTAVGVVVDTGLVQQMSVRPGSVQVAVGLDVVPVDGSAWVIADALRLTTVQVPHRIVYPAEHMPVILSSPAASCKTQWNIAFIDW